MSYLLNSQFNRILDIGLRGLDLEVTKIPQSGPSRFIADYMHLPEFKEVIDRTKSLQQVMNVSATNLIGFTKKNQETILQTLMHGGGLKNALALAGVKAANYAMWARFAEREIEPFATFIQECAKAEALLEVSLFQSMRAGGWKGAVEFYKITHPELFFSAGAGNQTAVQVNANISIMDRKPEERKALFEKYKQIHIDEKDIIEYNVKDPE